jgi:hypothetical protein
MKFENHKAGSIALETAGARRLFKFLTEQAPAKVAEANEQLFPGLIAAWAKTDDPADTLAAVSAVAAGGVWRLARIEAQNFGGLRLRRRSPNWAGSISWSTMPGFFGWPN